MAALYIDGQVMFGFSGVSSDFRDLLASQDPHVRFALEVFCCQTVRHMGSLVAKSVELTALFLPGASGKMPLVSAQRNNNAYCRDNEVIWFDWELRRTYADIHRIVRMMVAFRARRDVVIERSRLTLNELLMQARIE